MSIHATRVVNVRHCEYDVFIGRPGKYGNPFIIGRDGTRDEVCDKNWDWLLGKIKAPDGRKPSTIEEIKRELAGKRLGCFCPPQRCHGNNYVRICRGNYDH